MYKWVLLKYFEISSDEWIRPYKWKYQDLLMCFRMPPHKLKLKKLDANKFHEFCVSVQKSISMLLYPCHPNRWNFHRIDWDFEICHNIYIPFVKRLVFDVEEMLCSMYREEKYVSSKSRYMYHIANPEGVYTIISYYAFGLNLNMAHESHIFRINYDMIALIHQINLFVTSSSSDCTYTPDEFMQRYLKDLEIEVVRSLVLSIKPGLMSEIKTMTRKSLARILTKNLIRI